VSNKAAVKAILGFEEFLQDYGREKVSENLKAVSSPCSSLKGKPNSAWNGTTSSANIQTTHNFSTSLDTILLTRIVGKHFFH